MRKEGTKLIMTVGELLDLTDSFSVEDVHITENWVANENDIANISQNADINDMSAILRALRTYNH